MSEADDDRWQVHRAKLGASIREGQTEEAEAARARMYQALREQRIAELVRQAPPLSDARKARIAALLFGTPADPNAGQ